MTYGDIQWVFFLPFYNYIRKYINYFNINMSFFYII